MRTKSSKQATTTCYYFPQSTNKPRIHQSCVNQPTNKHTQNEILLVPRPAKITPRFMKPEGPLPCSQMSSTCLYPETDSSSPHPTILIPSLRSTLILPSCLRRQVLPHQNHLHISVFCRTCHMPHSTHSPTFITPIIIWLV